MEPIDNDRFQPESELGNIEHKRVLKDVSDDRFLRLQSQLKRRLGPEGEAVYRIGVDDNGDIYGLTAEEFNTSISILTQLAKSINATVSCIYEFTLKDTDKKYGVYVVRNNLEYIDIYIATGGNVDSGKSTFVGTMSSGELDDGAGKCARMVANYKHERDTGNTSSIGHEILGIKGNVFLNHKDTDLRHTRPEWPSIIKDSQKVISFIDLAGHETYIKTTIRGINGSNPDYVWIFFDGTKGDLGIATKDEDADSLDALIRGKKSRSKTSSVSMAMEHMKLCYIWKIPMVAVMTHIDVPNMSEKFDSTEKHIVAYCKRLRRTIVHVTSIHDVTDNLIERTKRLEVVPLIRVSNKTGEGHDIIKHILKVIPQTRPVDTTSTHFRYSIDETFRVKGYGLVVSGTVMSGSVRVGDTVKIGPMNSKPTYLEVRIRGIENKCVRVETAKSGQRVTFNLIGIERKMLRRGMVLLAKDSLEVAVRTFRAKIQLQKHSTITVKKRYQSVLYTGNIREACQIDYIENPRYTAAIKSLRDHVDIEVFRRDYSDIFELMIEQSPELKTITDEATWKALATARLDALIASYEGHIGPDDIGEVTLSTISRPVYLSVGTRFIWSDSFITCVGVVTEV